MSGRDAFSPSPPAMIMLFSIAFAGGTCYTIGAYAKQREQSFVSGGYENEEKNLDRDPYRRAAAESSAGDDAVGGGGRYVIDGD